MILMKKKLMEVIPMKSYNYFEDMKEGTIDGNNERTTEYLDGENLFSTNDKRLTDIIINKMKNEGKETIFIN